MDAHSNNFTGERIYLKGVSPATIEWYQDALDAWSRYSSGGPKGFVRNMRAAGMKAVSCNSWIYVMNDPPHSEPNSTCRPDRARGGILALARKMPPRKGTTRCIQLACQLVPDLLNHRCDARSHGR